MNLMNMTKWFRMQYYLWKGVLWRQEGYFRESGRGILLLGGWHNSSRVIAPPMFISLLFGILDGIKASAFSDILPSWAQRLPLAEQGLAWLMPTVVMVVLAIIWDRAAGRQVTSSAH